MTTVYIDDDCDDDDADGDDDDDDDDKDDDDDGGVKHHPYTCKLRLYTNTYSINTQITVSMHEDQRLW